MTPANHARIQSHAAASCSGRSKFLAIPPIAAASHRLRGRAVVCSARRSAAQQQQQQQRRQPAQPLVVYLHDFLDASEFERVAAEAFRLRCVCCRHCQPPLLPLQPALTATGILWLSDRRPCTRRPSLTEELNCIATGRLGCYLPPDSDTVAIFSAKPLAARLTKVSLLCHAVQCSAALCFALLCIWWSPSTSIPCCTNCVMLDVHRH